MPAQQGPCFIVLSPEAQRGPGSTADGQPGAGAQTPNEAAATEEREPPGVGAQARSGFVRAGRRGQSSSMGLLSS